MKLVIFGLSVSSSWGNGHATLWRGLCRALARRGHRVVFFERDVPYYAENRDLTELPGLDLILYPSWSDALPLARQHLRDAEAGVVTSYCPDALHASALLLDSPARLRVFYDMDSPVTLDRLRRGEQVEYVGPRGYQDFDLVLSFAGGRTLQALRDELGARRVSPLYGSVDPAIHHPVVPEERFRADLSYLGTYAADRQPAFHQLLIQPASRLPGRSFLVGGALYPDDFPWLPNISFLRHVAPGEHPAFFSSSLVTLNVSRRPMAESGYCPSGRIFEAASCGVPVITDPWEGIDEFYEPGREILVANRAEDVIASLQLRPEELTRIGARARERTLESHTAAHRVAAMESVFESVLAPVTPR